MFWTCVHSEEDDGAGSSRLLSMPVPTFFAKTTFLCLPLFLTPVSSLLSVHQGMLGFRDGDLRSRPAGTPTPAPTPAPANVSNPGRIWNLRMDPKGRRLAFQHWDNVTGFECLDDGLVKRKSENQAPGKSFCEFESLPVCKPRNFTVRTMTRDPRFFAFIMYPPAVGIQGAEARNFRCWVQMVSLACSWDVGPAAPPDIQYELTWEDHKKNEVHACPNYTRDAQGVHVRCDFGDVTEAIERNSGHCFRVKGVSKWGTIPCVDTCHSSLRRIEDLQADNVTFLCNGSDSKLTWAVRSLFQRRFNFDVEIKKGEEKPEIESVKDKFLSLANEEEKFDARIRVRSQSFNYWSAWGPSKPFGCNTKLGASSLGFWLPASLGVLCALLATGLAWVIWSRSSLREKLFPPIPKLRDLVRDAEALPSDRLQAAPKQDYVEDEEEEVEVVGEGPGLGGFTGVACLE